jgi:hypothetical protein
MTESRSPLRCNNFVKPASKASSFEKELYRDGQFDEIAGYFGWWWQWLGTTDKCQRLLIKRIEPGTCRNIGRQNLALPIHSEAQIDDAFLMVDLRFVGVLLELFQRGKQ